MPTSETGARLLGNLGGFSSREGWKSRENGKSPDQLPLARLDLEVTVRLNRERNVEFVLRTPDTSQP
jgi:hypothetical protein